MKQKKRDGIVSTPCFDKNNNDGDDVDADAWYAGADYR